MAVDERAAGLLKASQHLDKVTEQLQKFNDSAGADIAKIVGRDLKKVTDPFVSSIMGIPGVAMLGDVGKSLGNRVFAKMKEKREMEHLRQLINRNADGFEISKQEFEQLRLAQNVAKAELDAAQKMESAAKEILGFGGETSEAMEKQGDSLDKLLGNAQEQSDADKAESENQKKGLDGLALQAKEQVEILRKVNEDLGIKDLTAPLDEMALTAQKQLEIQQGGLRGKAREAEMEGERLRREEGRDTVFEKIASGIIGMQDALASGLANLKDKGLLGLGVLAGLVAAPFVAISAFFTQLGAEVKVLDKLLGGGLSRFFSPFTRFFNAIRDVFSKGGTGQFLKGDTMKFFGRFTDDIVRLIGNIKNFFKPLLDGIGKVVNLAKGSASFMSGFQPIVKFAATIGRTLGKIFLPITILMGVFDFVTGFMRGFKEDGIIGGIKEGIIGVVDGLVGGLLRMITGAFAFILEAIGLDNFAASLTENVNDAIEGVYEIFRGVIDVITFPFRLIFEMIKGIFGGETDFSGLFGGLGDSIMGIFDGLINIITAPFDMIYSLVQDIFSFVGFELPDFDIGETILGFISDAYDFVKNKVKGFFSFLGFGSEEEDLEKEVRAADKKLDIEERRSDIIGRADPNFETDAGKKALEKYGIALDESIAAEEALEAFRNKPKLTDVINTATEKTKEVFGSIGSAVSAGFSSAVAFVTDLFSFSSEDATVAGVATKLIDIILAPYNLAINFLRGIFGFGEDEEGNQLPSFSIGDLLIETMTNIFNWFSNLLDIDVGALVRKIPGAGKIIDFIFGDETDEEKIRDKEMQVAMLQKDVDTDRFYESDAQKERDKVALAEAMKELESMKTEAGMTTIVNNNNVVNANTSNNASTTTIAPMRDTTPPPGTVPAYG